MGAWYKEITSVTSICRWFCVFFFFFFKAEDGRRDRVRSRGLGDVYKRQARARHGNHEVAPHIGALEVAAHRAEPKGFD